MSAPVFIEPVINKEQGDCAITCLVMWTGKSYQDVIAAAPAKAHRQGMSGRQIVATAGKLGSRLRARRAYDLHGDDGILMLNPDPSKNPGQRWIRPSHAVVLVSGMILDPYNGRLWLDAEVFVKAERYRPGELLAEDE